jgi:hypothetical protein
MNHANIRMIRKAGSFLIAMGIGAAFAQSSFYNPQNCRVADKTSKEKFIESLGLTGGALSFWGAIAEDGHMSKLGSAIGFGLIVYKYFYDPKPVAVCYGTAPDGKRIGLIGEANVMLKPLPSLAQDYGKLGRALALAPLPSVSPSQQPPPATEGIELEKAFRGNQLIDLFKSHLQGSVKNSITGYPMSDVVVRIVSVENPGIWETVSTDSQGLFDVAELPGKYIVYAHADGFHDFTSTVTITSLPLNPLKIGLTRVLTPVP